MWALWRPDAVAVLKDEKARASLARYFSAMQDERPAKFLIAKKLPADVSFDEPLDELWLAHDELTERFYELEKEIDVGLKDLDYLEEPKNSYLDLKIEIAKRMMESCRFCVRRCNVNRLAGKLGYCRCGSQIAVSTIFEHLGEEPELVPSGTIFTLGCTMRCKHCQNWSICLTGDSLISLADGSLVKISNVVNSGMRKGGMKEIDEILCATFNLEVLTVDSQGKVVADKCNGLSKRKARLLLEITTRTGRKITVTPNHLLYTCSNGVISPVAADRLKRGDFVAVVRRLPDVKDSPEIEVELIRGKGNAHHITVPKMFSPELCRFLGYLLGDGHVHVKRERGIYSIVFTNKDQTLLNDYYDCCQKVFSLMPTIKRYDGTSNRAIIRSVELFRLLSQLAPPLLKYSKFREVPRKIMQCKREMIASFLRAFFDCEATVHPKSREVDLHSSSQKLLQQVQFLLCRFGIMSQLHSVVRNRGMHIKRAYKLSITGENIHHYGTYIGFTSLEKSEKLEKLLRMNIKGRPHLDVIPNVSDLLKDIRRRLRLSQRDVRRSIKDYGFFEEGHGDIPVFRMKQIVSIFESRLKEIQSLSQQLQKPKWSELTRVRKVLRVSEQKVADALGVSRRLIGYYKYYQNKPNSKNLLNKIVAVINNLCLQILSDKTLIENLSKLRMLADSDIFWDKVVKVKPLKRKGQWVYDIRVEGTQRFIANTFLVHNSQWYEHGEIYSPEQLARAVERLRMGGCRNVNLVGGEPTPWLQLWLEAFKHVSVNVPIVWNSNSYYSEETANLLAGFVDVYLLDFKYGPGGCAERISEAPKYWEVCIRNHLYAKRYGELIIRVLVLPEHLECCVKPILSWISKDLGPLTRTNVMFQYRPEWRAYEVPELRRRLTRAEMERAIQIAREVGLMNFIT